MIAYKSYQTCRDLFFLFLSRNPRNVVNSKRNRPDYYFPDHSLTNDVSQQSIFQETNHIPVQYSSLQKEREFTRILLSGLENTEIKWVNCDICNFRTVSREYIVRHMTMHRKKHNSDETGFCCKVCGYKMAHRSTLIRHMRSHTDEKPFSCTFDQCGKTFTINIESRTIRIF